MANCFESAHAAAMSEQLQNFARRSDVLPA
jgi:hypothetical protein